MTLAFVNCLDQALCSPHDSGLWLAPVSCKHTHTWDARLIKAMHTPLAFLQGIASHEICRKDSIVHLSAAESLVSCGQNLVVCPRGMAV